MLAFESEDFRVGGVRVAPADVVADRFGECVVVGVVAVVDREFAKRSEVRLDRVRPRRVGRGEAQLDGVFRTPLSKVFAAMVVEVVQDHVDRFVVRAQFADGLQRAQRRRCSLARFDPAIEAVVAERVPAEQLPCSVRLVIVRA